MARSGTLTYADLASFPHDGLRRELIDGALIASPAPRIRHQEIARRLVVMLSIHIDHEGGGRVFIGPVDIVFADDTVLEPDLIVVTTNQNDIVTEVNVRGAPALVIEVLSEPRIDRVRKRDVYARFGVATYWVVDPDADRVEVYRLEDDRYGKPEILEPGETLTYDGLPGLEIDLSTLFAR
jgi:Uma2 family endonuclease